VEVVFNFFLQFRVHRLLAIEFLNGSKEFGEPISFIKRLVESLEFRQDIDKVTHDVRKDTDSKQ
jgi:hypothetical protein